MNESSDSEINKDVNESQFFEENNLYILGKTFKKSLSGINDEFDKLENLFTKEEFNNIENDLLIDDIKINSLEDEVENLIKNTINSVCDSKHKKLFILKNDEENNNTKNDNNTNNNNNQINVNKNESNLDIDFENSNENDITIKKEEEENNNKTNNKKKINYLRNEAKVLEETMSKLDLTDYQTMKKEKFKGCELNSLIFFKNSKKEIGKENNYIFNYRDNFLNDMSKIDQLFFKDYFKPKEVPKSNKLDLVYEFYIYHPIKNVKTQQISILGDGVLKQLKDKIYCVLDEIQSDSTRSFFFIEKVFYDDIPGSKKDKYIEPLSFKISQLRLQKLTLKDYEQDINYNRNNPCPKDLESKFNYDKNLYCEINPIMINRSHSYDSLNMNTVHIEDIPFRIGYPYIFRHIESCDHVIILNDIRVIDKYDNFSEKDNKAIVTYKKKNKRKKCDACKFYYAKFISINDIVVGNMNNALFLCDYCLKKLHETELQDNNTSNLKLIPYFHN